MLNRIEYQGRFTRDIELKQTQSGISYTEFTLAWSEKYKEVESKCFLRCKAWRNTADFLSRFFSKGEQVLVEGRMQTEEWEKDGEKQEDYIMDDTALAYVGENGLSIITGCSHAGICNIIEYAKKLTGVQKVQSVLGGFHLFDVDEREKATIAYLKEEKIPELYPCHCTSFAVRAALHAEAPVKEVAVGTELEWK